MSCRRRSRSGVPRGRVRSPAAGTDVEARGDRRAALALTERRRDGWCRIRRPPSVSAPSANSRPPRGDVGQASGDPLQEVSAASTTVTVAAADRVSPGMSPKPRAPTARDWRRQSAFDSRASQRLGLEHGPDPLAPRRPGRRAGWPLPSPGRRNTPDFPAGGGRGEVGLREMRGCGRTHTAAL
jgi:hypothetical protein